MRAEDRQNQLLDRLKEIWLGVLVAMQETVQTSSQATLRKAFKNPHGTNAFFACLFVLC